MVHSSVEDEKCGGRQQKEYAAIYWSTVDIATKQLTGSVKEFLKHWSPRAVTVEKESLGSEERKGTVKGISRIATILWRLPSGRMTFISVNER